MHLHMLLFWKSCTGPACLIGAFISCLRHCRRVNFILEFPYVKAKRHVSCLCKYHLSSFLHQANYFLLAGFEVVKPLMLILWWLWWPANWSQSHSAPVTHHSTISSQLKMFNWHKDLRKKIPITLIWQRQRKKIHAEWIKISKHFFCLLGHNLVTCIKMYKGAKC